MKMNDYVWFVLDHRCCRSKDLQHPSELTTKLVQIIKE